MLQRAVFAGFLLASAVAGAQPAGERALVTLTFDDSRNPTPFGQMYYCAQWNPDTGEFSDNWMDYRRHPMVDDGTGGDVVAGDRIWTVQASVRPLPGQPFYWATDSDTEDDNGWLGTWGSVLVESTARVSTSARSMPDESYATPEEFGRLHGFDPKVVGPPRLLADGARILFTFRHTDARRVFIAGNFNDWARNQNGRTSDPQSILYPSADGVWFRTVRIEAPEIQYKFVVEKPDGSFQWVSDPEVSQRDKDGNSLVQRRQLLDSMVTPTAAPEAQGPRLRWRPYDATLLQQVREREGSVLLFVRVEGNPRSEEFARSFLETPEVRTWFKGRTLLSVNPADAPSREFLKERRITRIPALAACTADGTWTTLPWRPQTPPEEVRAFLRTAAGVP